VFKVAKAILSKMSHLIRLPKTPDEWKRIASDFEKKTFLPHCVGALGMFYPVT